MVKNDFCLEAFCVLQKALHQLGPLHAMYIGGPVVDVSGGHQLATLCDAGYQDRIEVGSGRINGGSVASGAGAKNKNF